MTDVLAVPAVSVGSPQALAGVRVVEIGFAAAGPLVGKHLANHGAEVIHVESRTAPDVFRSTYPPFKDNTPGLDRAAMFAFYNDGKRGVTLNLKHPRAVELVSALVARSDVLIESFPAGTMAKRGLEYRTFAAANPGLVMLSSCNQGQTGPHAQHPGYGSQLTCLAGFVHMLGDPDGSPVILYGPYIDYVAVGYGVIAILAALARRRATGKGTYIDLSQYEAGLQFMGPALLEYQLNGRVPARSGNRDLVAAPHGVFRCLGEDRWCVLSVWDDDEWGRFREALGDPEWSRDEQFARAEGRRAAEDELERRISEWTCGRVREDVVARLRERGLHAAPVVSIGELFADPQLAYRSFWRGLPHPVIGTLQCMSSPAKLSTTPARQERAGPTMGEGNEYVFGQLLGLSEEERAALAHDGVFD